jgi:inorganic phosphate transporter, PiT family
VLLTAVGLGFAVLNGTNDGGALVAASLKAPGIRPAVGIVAFGVALGVVPVVFGLRVATTLAGGLVPSDAEGQRLLMLMAVAASLAVVGLLNVKGLPTSLTLALVGGLVGAGIGSGAEVSWGLVLLTAAAGIVTPLLGGLLGAVLRNVPLLAARRGVERRHAARAHTVSFALQAIAYAANDGQKMYAVLAAGTLATAAAATPAWHFVAVPTLFSVGAVLGVRRAARTLGGAGVLRARPSDEVAAELSSAVAVLGSAGVGIPVSMTQAVAGSLIGTGVMRGAKRVRWRAAARLALAWVLTLPSSAALGAGLGAALAAAGRGPA